jgi:hypothetical protein
MYRVVVAVCLGTALCAGCAGGAAPPHRPATPRLPPALAASWAGRAGQIAAVAAAGNGCEARRLAGSFRDAVIRQEGEVPLRLRTSLVRTVATLADRIACVPPTITTYDHPHPHPEPPKPPKDHGHGHGPHGHDHGDGG